MKERELREREDDGKGRCGRERENKGLEYK